MRMMLEMQTLTGTLADPARVEIKSFGERLTSHRERIPQ